MVDNKTSPFVTLPPIPRSVLEGNFPMHPTPVFSAPLELLVFGHRQSMRQAGFRPDGSHPHHQGIVGWCALDGYDSLRGRTFGRVTVLCDLQRVLGQRDGGSVEMWIRGNCLREAPMLWLEG